MNPLLIAGLAAGAYFLLSGRGASFGGPIPAFGQRTPPQPGQAARAGAPVGANPAGVITAVGGAVANVAGAAVNIWDTLSTSQDSPPDPAPSGFWTAPMLSGGGMAGSDWSGFAPSGTSFDPSAGDALFTSAP